jgi:hypothetical protein
MKTAGWRRPFNAYNYPHSLVRSVDLEPSGLPEKRRRQIPGGTTHEKLVWIVVLLCTLFLGSII